MELNRKYPNITPFISGLIVSSSSIGSIIGSIIITFIIDKLGRKFVLSLGIIISINSVILLFFSLNLTQIIIIRIISGVGLSFITITSPMYSAEISPESIRGMVSSTYVVFIQFGILVSYIISYLLEYPRYKNSEFSWRIMFGIEIIPLVVYLILVILKMETTNNNNINEIENKNHNINCKDLLSKKYIRPILIGIFLLIADELTGINGISSYIKIILNSSSIKNNASLFSLIIMIVKFISTFVPLSLSDRLGRKYLLITGLIITTISLICIIISIRFVDEMRLGWLLFMFILIFFIGYHVGPGSHFTIIINEIYEYEVKSKILGLLYLTGDIVSLILTLIFPIMFNINRYSMFIIYFIFSTTSLIFLFILYKDN